MGEWRQEPLDRIASLVTDRISSRKDPAMPYVGLEHLPSRGTSVLGMGEAEDSVSINNVFRAGDVLFGKLRPRLRKSLQVHFDGYCSTDVLVLRSSGGIHPAFAGFVLQSDEVFAEAIRTEEGTKMPRCSWNTIRKLRVLCPDFGQQKRIAEILTTIDEAIERTEALIAKLQQIKAGLMHDLFTRGVLPDGQLRPPRDEASQLYKKSPLGWIPKEWEAKPCVSLTDMITVGIVFRPAQYYVGEGVPAFRSANIREDGIDPTDLVFISQQSNAKLPKSQVRAGDVLSVRTGYPGTSAVVMPEYAGANCIDILISRPSYCLRSNYLVAWINSPFGKEQVLRKQGGLAQQHFNVGELRDLLVALPSTPEQDQIIARLSVVNGRLAEESTLARKYQAMKCGLMHDLLSGRVRVSVAKAQKVASNV